MRHFLYFENGGPFPGTCISCGDNKHLYDIQGTRIDGGNNLLCKKCVGELASFAGYAEEAPYEAAVAEAMKRNADLEEQLNKVPNLVDGLINGIRSSVTDFVFAVSYSNSASNSKDAEGIIASVAQSDEHAQRPKPDTNSPKQSTRK